MTITQIPTSGIPGWLHKEVEEYFVPLPFVPESILDIGANVGAFAQRAHERWPKARIVCCEPMPFNVVNLRRNLSFPVEIISAAVRECAGIDEIFVGDNFVTGSFIQMGRQTNRKVLVECIAAKDLPRCELVKIDTEGCEVEILRGLDLQKTRAVLLEHHSRQDAETIKAMLSPNFRLLNQDAGHPVGTLNFLRSDVIDGST